MTWLQCLKQMDVMNLVALCAATLALFLAGVLTGLKLGGGRRSSGSGYSGGSRTVRSPDLYIGNLTEDVSGEELEKQFGKFGDVKEGWIRSFPKPDNRITRTSCLF